MKFNSRGEYEGGNFNALVTMKARQTLIHHFVENVEKKDLYRLEKENNPHPTG